MRVYDVVSTVERHTAQSARMCSRPFSSSSCCWLWRQQHNAYSVFCDFTTTNWLRSLPACMIYLFIMLVSVCVCVLFRRKAAEKFTCSLVRCVVDTCASALALAYYPQCEWQTSSAFRCCAHTQVFGSLFFSKIINVLCCCFLSANRFCVLALGSNNIPQKKRRNPFCCVLLFLSGSSIISKTPFVKKKALRCTLFVRTTTLCMCLFDFWCFVGLCAQNSHRFSLIFREWCDSIETRKTCRFGHHSTSSSSRRSAQVIRSSLFIRENRDVRTVKQLIQR